MKRISDLLDDFQPEDIPINEETPLYQERIRKLTMDRVRLPKKRKIQVLSKVAAIAAAVSVLAVTAMAAEYVWGVKDWFGSAFNFRAKQIQEAYERENIEVKSQGSVILDKKFAESMSQGQLAAVEAMGQVKNAAVTSGGATVTLQAVCSDEYIMYLYFDVEAPEGVILPDDFYYTFRGEKENNLTVAGNHSLGSWDMNLETLPDGDPTDNQKSFQLTLMREPGNRNGTTLNDGVKKTLNLNGLYAYETDENHSPIMKTKQTLFLGDFDFDITNAVPSQRVDVGVAGITYELPIVTQDGGERLTTKVVAESLRIGPLTAEWVGTGSVYLDVYMKDGTKAYNAGGWANTVDGKCYETRIFAYPIDLSQIDYVVLGGNQTVYVEP